ncbi:MAG: hypothetical protein HFF08_11395 [Oscillospiraceae bacterium]|nr:hypothetical protein [Oscillospiraceae bacterium]
MIDVFRECREQVSAEDAARRYGLTFDRRGWALCPFHSDTRASMSFRADRFRCWACNASGDSIDFTARLFGLEPLAAVEKLNSDFNLNIPLHRQPTPEELQAARRRAEVVQAHKDFEEWRKALISKLCRVCFLAHDTLKGAADLENLTPAEALAVRWQSYLEYLVDCLESGDMAEKMAIFRERGRIGDLCEKILNSTPERSSAA